MVQIINDYRLIELVPTLDNNQKILLKDWMKETLIPYVSYLETELQYSTPLN